MRTTLRLCVLACVAAAALSFVGAALAVPRLIIGGVLKQGAAQTSIQFTEEKSDAAPARVVIYAPAGYSGTVTASPNTVLGTVHADLQALAISPDALIQADGQIIALDPAANTNNSCAPGAHTAVWALRVTVSGQTLNIPVYVDAPTPATDPLALQSPMRLIFCLPSPYIPEAAGGGAFGAKVINAQLTLNQGTLRTPVARGTYVWRAVVTPWQVGGALPNAAGTVEARGIFRTPAILSIAAKVTNKKQHRVRITGVLRYGDATLGQTRVSLARGSKANRLRTTTRATTNANGTAAFYLRFKKKGTVYFRLSATPAARNFPAGCTPATAPSLPCASATLSGFSVMSRVVRIKL